MKGRITEILDKAYKESLFSAAVAGYVDCHGKGEIVPVGGYPVASEYSYASPDTLFDVASITKAIPVSSLALYLLDQGVLTLSTRVSSILPEFKTSFFREVTLWHLLTQTLDYRTSLASISHLPAERIRDTVLNATFLNKPGTLMNYTNATSIVLGMVVETATGKNLDRLADEIFFVPLGMSHTSFHPDRFSKKQIVPTENDPNRKRIIHGEIHDESAAVLSSLMIPGSAGIFSTVPDLLTFMQMLIQQGMYEKKRYFSEAMVHSMAENQLGTIATMGLGWEIQQPHYMGEYVSNMTISKTGFTGCVVIGDIKKGKAMVLLTNYHFPKRKTSWDAMNKLRCDIADIVFAD